MIDDWNEIIYWECLEKMANFYKKNFFFQNLAAELDANAPVTIDNNDLKSCNLILKSIENNWVLRSP